MATNKNDKIKDLLEDLDLHQFIYNDLVSSRPNDSEAIAEALEAVKGLEAKVGELLGEAAPPIPQPTAPATASERDPPPAWRQDVATTPRPAAPSSSGQLAPSTLTSPRREGPSLDLPAHTMAPHLRADPSSVPYWPSSAPSPFAASSTRQPEYSLPIPSEGSRKRPRQDSGSIPAQPQSAKRSILTKSKSRMEEIDAEMETQLAQNRYVYEGMKHPENVRRRAMIEGISEDQVRQDIDKDREEMEHLIREEYQLERDGELARMLQAQEEPSEDERDLSPRPTFSPRPTLESHTTFNLPDRTQFNPPPSTSAQYIPGIPFRGPNSRYIQPYEFIKPSPHPIYPIYPNFPVAEDDDLQEISPAYFNSRLGGTPRFGPRPMHRRPLPWLQDPWGGDTNAAGKAMDLAREQMELDVDDDDFVYVSIASL